MVDAFAFFGVMADCGFTVSVLPSIVSALVEHFADRPNLLPDATGLDAGSPAAFRAAVAYVGGMTDRFACRQALALLGWDRDRLPVGIDV